VPVTLAEHIAQSVLGDLKNAALDSVSEQEGRLLSFVPTSSNGMSPALEEVSRSIEERFPLVGTTPLLF